jgi:hypothetical protein
MLAGLTKLDWNNLIVMNDNVVDLEKQRDNFKSPLDALDRALPPGTPKEKIDQILAREDAVDYLQSLDSHTFYRLIKQAGWDQSYDLVQYATPRQVQNFLDFDCWTRDRLIPKKMEKWLAALVSESTQEHLQEVCRDLDAEMLAYFFKDNLEVEEVEEGRIPDHLDGNVSLSPDNQYAIVYPEDEDTASVLRMLIDRLYGADRMLGWTLLEAVRWELPSELEEYAYKWRKSRIEEFGFIPREEAIEIYQYVDPKQLRDRLDENKDDDYVDLSPPETIDPPVLLEEELTEEFFFSEALNEVENAETIQRIIHQTISLLHRAMMSDGVEPGDLESGRQVVRRTFGYLSAGLDFLSRDDTQRAAALISDKPLKLFHQAGFSLARKFQSKIDKLEDNPTLTLLDHDDYSLLTDDDRALVEALKRKRPYYSRSATEHEIFKEQEQIDEAANRIGLIAFKQLWLFQIAISDIDDLADSVYTEQTINSPAAITFDNLFATYLANFILDGEPKLEPLSPDALSQLTEQLQQEQPSLEPLLDELESKTSAEAMGLVERWVDTSFSALNTGLGEIAGTPEPEYLTDLLLLETQ